MAISCQKRSPCFDMFPICSVFFYYHVFSLFYCSCLSIFWFFTTNTAQHKNKQHTQTQTHTTTTTTTSHHKTPHNTPHTTIQHTPHAPATGRDVRHTVFLRIGQLSTWFLIVIGSLLVFFLPLLCKVQTRVAHSIHVSARPSFTMQVPCSIDRPTFFILGERRRKTNRTIPQLFLFSSFPQDCWS